MPKVITSFYKVKTVLQGKRLLNKVQYDMDQIEEYLNHNLIAMKIVKDTEDYFHCPVCDGFIKIDFKACPYCFKRLKK